MTVWTVVETWTAIVVTCLGFSWVVGGSVEVLCLAGWANMSSWLEEVRGKSGRLMSDERDSRAGWVGLGAVGVVVEGE